MDTSLHRRGMTAALITILAATSQLACSSPKQPADGDNRSAPAAPVPATPEPDPVDIAPTPAANQPPVQAPTPDTPASTQVPPMDPPPMPSTPGDQTPAPPAPDAEPVTVVIYALSRGKGVPPETRDTYKQIHALLEQRKDASAITRLESSRMGLEGETRLCVEFRDREQANPALADIRKLAAGADLLNIVEEPCPGYKGSKP